jgi:hypothetical protein
MITKSRFFDDGVIGDEEAYRILYPHYKDIIRPIQWGINVAEKLKQQAAEYCHVFTSRSWANIVHDHMEDEARKIFSTQGKDIAVFPEMGFLIIDFYESIYLRYKKLRHNLRPCNIETDQQRAFDSQTLFRGPVTHVTAGYRLNDLGLYQDAHIVCWSGGKFLWSLRLPDIIEGQQGPPSIVIIPEQPKPPKQPIIIAKKSKVK